MEDIELNKKVAELVKRPWCRVLVPELDDNGVSAQVPELPGCISDGDTFADALTNLEDALSMWLTHAVEQGQDIPTPYGELVEDYKIVIEED